MTVSTPVKVVALAALALVLGMGGLLMLFSHKGSAPERIPAVHHAKAAVTLTPAAYKAHPKAKPKPKIVLASSLPSGLRRGLLKSPEVVVVVFASNVPGGPAAAAAARDAARAAHVGFVALNVKSNATAAAVAAWTANTATPAVYIVRRPGSEAAYTFSGPADRDTITAAARSAR